MVDNAVNKTNTPNLDELTERIGQLHGLLQSPEPGLISWKMALAERISDLIDWWLADEKPEPVQSEKFGNFDNLNHALKAGMLLGVLIKHGVPAYPVTDWEGNYVNKIEIHDDNISDPVGMIEIQVLS